MTIEPCDHCGAPKPDWIVGVSIDEIFGHYQFACNTDLPAAANAVLDLIGDGENGRLELQATRYLD